MPRTRRRRGRAAARPPLIKYQDRTKLVLANLARSRNHGPSPIPIEEVLAAFKEDAEESGQRLGRGWEARVKSCVESDIRDGYLLRRPGNCVSVTERARNPAREIRRDQRLQEFSSPEQRKREFAKSFGQLTGSTVNMTKAQLIRRVGELEKKEQPTQAAAPLRDWPSASTLTEMGQNDNDQDGMEVDAMLQSSMPEPVTPGSPRPFRVRFDVAVARSPDLDAMHAYPSPTSIPRPPHSRPFRPEAEFPTTPSRTGSTFNVMLGGSASGVNARVGGGEAGPSRFVDRGGPSNAMLSDFDPHGVEEDMGGPEADDDNDTTMGQNDVQPMEEDHEDVHARELTDRDEKIVGLETENADLRVQTDDLRTEITTFKEQNAGLETRHTTLQADLAEKQAQMDAVRVLLTQRNEEKIVLEERIQEVAARQRDLLARIDELQQQNHTLRDDANEVERDRLRQENQNILQKLDTLLTQMESLREDLRQGQSRMEAQGKECNELMKLLNSERDMNHDLRFENQRLLNEQDRFNLRITDLEAQVAKLDDEIVRHRNRIRDANNKEWELRNRIQHHGRDFDELENEHEELRQILLQERAAMRELELEKETVERELHAVESEVQEMYLFAANCDEAKQKALQERDNAQQRLDRTLERMRGVIRDA